MKGDKITLKNKIFSLPLLGLEKYFYSFFFPLVVALFTVLCYVGNITVVGIVVFVIVASFIVLTTNDLSLLLPLLFCFPPLLRTIDFFSHIENYLLFVPFIICLITNFIRFPIKKVVIGKLFFPLLAFALFISSATKLELAELSVTNKITKPSLQALAILADVTSLQLSPSEISSSAKTNISFASSLSLNIR